MELRERHRNPQPQGRAARRARKSLGGDEVGHFHPPREGQWGNVTVKLAGHKVQLFTVTGKVKVKHSGATEALTGMTAKLTNAGATKLDKALNKNALTAGQAIGSFTVKVSDTPIAGPGAGTTGSGLRESPFDRAGEARGG